MLTHVVVASLVALGFASPSASAQSPRIVATTTGLGSLARAVTGDLAQVETIVPPAADPEAFEPRPSDLTRLKGAAVVVRVGLGYDHWLDKLLSAHGDDALNRRGDGYVDASLGIPLLEVKGSSLDPANQDGHAMVSPIRTIGSIPPMPRSSPAASPKRSSGCRRR
jgi:ABC-type Zn uptake system ZnuABC Zn-binding protein ZnuA